MVQPVRHLDLTTRLLISSGVFFYEKWSNNKIKIVGIDVFTKWGLQRNVCEDPDGQRWNNRYRVLKDDSKRSLFFFSYQVPSRKSTFHRFLEGTRRNLIAESIEGKWQRLLRAIAPISIDRVDSVPLVCKMVLQLTMRHYSRRVQIFERSAYMLPRVSGFTVYRRESRGNRWRI